MPSEISLDNGASSDLLEIIIKTLLNASKNAMIYGYRVRFIHSISIQLLSINKNQNLFKQLVQKLIKSVRLSLDHGKILAAFAVVYNFVLILLNNLTNNCSGSHDAKQKKKIENLNNFISGFIGGAVIYGGLLTRQSPGLLNESITKQITLYCLSRVALGSGKFIAREISKAIVKSKRSSVTTRAGHGKNALSLKKVLNKTETIGWCLSSGVIWGSVMMFYSYDRDFMLQKSLKLSLDFIYGGSFNSWFEAFNYSR